MDTQARKRLSNKAVYGPLSQKTLHSALKRELLTNFGFDNMALIADLLIDRFLAIVDEFSTAPGQLQPDGAIRHSCLDPHSASFSRYGSRHRSTKARNSSPTSELKSSEPWT